MRLLAFSDLHLDRAFAWATPAVARRRRAQLRATLQNVVALVGELRVDALLCAGDLYEHERVAPDTAAFLARVLDEAGVPVLLAPGNHDPCTPDSVYAEAAWSDRVHVFDHDRLVPYRLADGFTVWGGAHLSTAGTGNFLDGFRVEGGGVHVGLFHGAERRGLAQEGTAKAPHAPFDGAEIRPTGLHYAVVGHYHRPRDDDRHGYTYPGCPMPLDFGLDEPGSAVLVDVGDDGRVTVTRHAVAASPAHDRTLDVTGVADEADLLARAAAVLDGLDGVVRLTLDGELAPGLPTDADLLARHAPAADAVVVRRDKLRPAYDLDELGSADDVRGRFVRAVLDAGYDADTQRRVLTCGLRALDGHADLEVA